MILLDFSQVTISNLFQNITIFKDLNEDMLRHMVLNSIRAYNKKFVPTYGELVICCDGNNYWRKDVFPQYKANRKKDRTISGLDWHSIFSYLNKVRQELIDYFPYRVMLVERAEADDIIAVLARKYSLHQSVLILSGDKDFQQLQKYPNITQYSPVQKTFIKAQDPNRFLFDQIIKGDRGDGVPNFLSDDDSLVTGTRQVPIRETTMDKWYERMLSSNNLVEATFDNNTKMIRGFKRNEQLIDLEHIPQDLCDSIITEFEKPFHADRSKIFTYFTKKRLKHLMEDISDF